MSDRLRVVVAAPFDPALAPVITDAEPRIDLIVDHDLLPPMRHAADFSGDPSFRRTAEQQREFDALVDSADVLYGIPDVDSAALARTVRANPGLRWVQTMAAGGGAQVRAAELESRELERVTFTTSAGVHGRPLAEFAVFGVLAGAKDLPRLAAQQRWRRWTGRWAMKQVSDMTIVVLGLGGIGRETARTLSLLGANVIGFSRSGEGAPEGTVGERIDRLAEYLPQADAIVVTLPGTTATEGLVGDAVFDAVKPGAIVVNVGRGTVIDEDALVRALADGRVGFAALDVFAVEPLAGTSPLWDHPNVLVSPHTAALDPREERRIAELFADNATRLLDGRPLRNVVDTVEFY
ncbi:D-2-hydroxyacid dehydrogenase [Microbacterium sp. NPDC056044]|uniref:D-2-hydroxyacid dehydrogenase n=1 Tax=Microbacterium sp. NPDC056044 TaxID=3345690 RepID=UPI0035DF42A2